MAQAKHVMALYRQYFPSFLRFAFRELHAGRPPIETPCVDVLADYLVRVASGEIARLIINMPPGTMKSLAASIALPVWMLGRDPTKQIISIAGSRIHTTDLEATTKPLILGHRCHALFPHMQIADQPGDIVLPHGGRRHSATVGCKLPGGAIDLVVVDDPVLPVHIQDAAKLNSISRWIEAEVLNKLDDQSPGAIVIVTRRLHFDDLCGQLLDSKQNWVHLNMPAIAVTDECWALSGGNEFIRRQGEALAPELADKEQLHQQMLKIGAYRFGAEYQQRPFERMNKDEMRYGSFGGREDDPVSPPMWLGGIPERAIMQYEIFGVGSCHPAPPPRRFTIESGPLPVEDVEDDAVLPT